MSTCGHAVRPDPENSVFDGSKVVEAAEQGGTASNRAYSKPPWVCSLEVLFSSQLRVSYKKNHFYGTGENIFNHNTSEIVNRGSDKLSTPQKCFDLGKSLREVLCK